MTDNADRSGQARIVVTAGNPTPQEAAAVVVVLDTIRRARRAAGAPRRDVPAWQRAAYVEGVGGRPVASPADLRGR